MNFAVTDCIKSSLLFYESEFCRFGAVSVRTGGMRTRTHIRADKEEGLSFLLSKCLRADMNFAVIRGEQIA